jgi:hypothetical protein
MEKRHAAVLTVLLATACVFLSCGDGIIDGFTPFDIYGRVVYRPPFFGSFAEFYVYHDGQPATDALITVESDTIPLVSERLGHYSKAMAFEMGDTLEYSVESAFGSSQGSLIIPDTTEIISPAQDDTLQFGTEFTSDWRPVISSDGYYVYLENQGGFVALVEESRFDTSAVIPGDEFIEGGADYLWVETLSGDVVKNITPDGRVMPLGVFGAAGNYREVYISLLGQSE